MFYSTFVVETDVKAKLKVQHKTQTIGIRGIQPADHAHWWATASFLGGPHRDGLKKS